MDNYGVLFFHVSISCMALLRSLFVTHGNVAELVEVEVEVVLLDEKVGTLEVSARKAASLHAFFTASFARVEIFVFIIHIDYREILLSLQICLLLIVPAMVYAIIQMQYRNPEE